MKKDLPRLSPKQQQTFKAVKAAVQTHNILHIWAGDGFGRSTVLQHLQAELDAKLIGMKEFIEAQKGQHPYSVEDNFYALLEANLDSEKPLIIDDAHMVFSIGECCSSHPRSNYYEALASAVAKLINEKQCQLILGSDGGIPSPLSRSAFVHGIGELEIEDYRHIIGASEPLKKIDVSEVHRFAPRLNFYQLTQAVKLCVEHSYESTDKFIDYLCSQQLASNVELSEVDQIQLSDLVGIDELVDSLESNVAFPLENDALAQKYSLQPKRGVLLLGPPGTGKTTIGKALAHRLKGKFFLIDGTFISGTDNFYYSISRIFEQAKANAPAVIFVDDSDVIFESGQEHGLYRYLLTMLDGLESESAGRVCVMLTAMDIRHIPPALIRSGRVELWLETKLPDQAARATLIEKLVADLNTQEMGFDIDELSLATDGFTPADLKRLVNESKVKYAWAESKQREMKTLTQYMMDSIVELKSLKQRYSESRKAGPESANRPVWFDVAT